MVENGGYDEIVIEDFYDTFIDNLKKLETLHADWDKEGKKGSYSEYVWDFLTKLLCNHEEANYIIMFSRFLAAAYLKKNAILFEDFLGESM